MGRPTIGGAHGVPISFLALHGCWCREPERGRAAAAAKRRGGQQCNGGGRFGLFPSLPIAHLGPRPILDPPSGGRAFYVQAPWLGKLEGPSWAVAQAFREGTQSKGSARSISESIYSESSPIFLIWFRVSPSKIRRNVIDEGQPVMVHMKAATPGRPAVALRHLIRPRLGLASALRY